LFVSTYSLNESRSLGVPNPLRLNSYENGHAQRPCYIASICTEWGMLSLRFVEVYVKAILNTCRKDRRGVYAKAKRGEINNMTGIQDPYEEPENPDIVIDREKLGPEECADMLIKELHRLGYLQPKGR
jgi:hypothetical protein